MIAENQLKKDNVLNGNYMYNVHDVLASSLLFLSPINLKLPMSFNHVCNYPIF